MKTLLVVCITQLSFSLDLFEPNNNSNRIKLMVAAKYSLASLPLLYAIITTSEISICDAALIPCYAECCSDFLSWLRPHYAKDIDFYASSLKSALYVRAWDNHNNNHPLYYVGLFSAISSNFIEYKKRQ